MSDLSFAERKAWVIWARALMAQKDGLSFTNAFGKAVFEAQPNEEVSLWLARILFTRTLEAINDQSLKTLLAQFSLVN